MSRSRHAVPYFKRSVLAAEFFGSDFDLSSFTKEGKVGKGELADVSEAISAVNEAIEPGIRTFLEIRNYRGFDSWSLVSKDASSKVKGLSKIPNRRGILEFELASIAYESLKRPYLAGRYLDYLDQSISVLQPGGVVHDVSVAQQFGSSAVSPDMIISCFETFARILSKDSQVFQIQGAMSGNPWIEASGAASALVSALSSYKEFDASAQGAKPFMAHYLNQLGSFLAGVLAWYDKQQSGYNVKQSIAIDLPESLDFTNANATIISLYQSRILEQAALARKAHLAELTVADVFKDSELSFKPDFFKTFFDNQTKSTLEAIVLINRKLPLFEIGVTSYLATYAQDNLFVKQARGETITQDDLTLYVLTHDIKSGGTVTEDREISVIENELSVKRDLLTKSVSTGLPEVLDVIAEYLAIVKEYFEVWDTSRICNFNYVSTFVDARELILRVEQVDRFYKRPQVLMVKKSGARCYPVFDFADIAPNVLQSAKVETGFDISTKLSEIGKDHKDDICVDSTYQFVFTGDIDELRRDISGSSYSLEINYNPDSLRCNTIDVTSTMFSIFPPAMGSDVPSLGTNRRETAGYLYVAKKIDPEAATIGDLLFAFGGRFVVGQSSKDLENLYKSRLSNFVCKENERFERRLNHIPISKIPDPTIASLFDTLELAEAQELHPHSKTDLSTFLDEAAGAKFRLPSQVAVKKEYSYSFELPIEYATPNYLALSSATKTGMVKGPKNRNASDSFTIRLKIKDKSKISVAITLSSKDDIDFSIPEIRKSGDTFRVPIDYRDPGLRNSLNAGNKVGFMIDGELIEPHQLYVPVSYLRLGDKDVSSLMDPQTGEYTASELGEEISSMFNAAKLRNVGKMGSVSSCRQEGLAIRFIITLLSSYYSYCRDRYKESMEDGSFDATILKGELEAFSSWFKSDLSPDLQIIALGGDVATTVSNTTAKIDTLISKITDNKANPALCQFIKEAISSLSSFDIERVTRFELFEQIYITKGCSGVVNKLRKGYFFYIDEPEVVSKVTIPQIGTYLNPTCVKYIESFIKNDLNHSILIDLI